jgi:ABC-type phosphate transport system auxiliary subunit
MNRQLQQYETDMALEQQAMTIALAVAYDVFKHSASAANARQAKAMAELDYLQAEAMTKRRKALAAAEDAMGHAAHWDNVASDLQREVAELKRELIALQAELNFEKPQQVKRKKAHGGRRDYEGE